MERTSLRFSLNKKSPLTLMQGILAALGLSKTEARVNFSDFVTRAYELVRLVKEVRPASSAKILTCEDEMVYNYSTVSIVTEDAEAMWKKRKGYPLIAFTQEVWEHSLKCQLFIHDSSDQHSFMVAMTCDRRRDGSRILFYGQGLDPAAAEIVKTFAQSTPDWEVGEGWSKLSLFNGDYIRKHNRLRHI